MEEVTKTIKGILGIVFITIGLIIIKSVFFNESIDLIYTEASIFDLLKAIFHI